MKKIQAQEITQSEIIRAVYKKLGKCRSDELVAMIDDLPTRKKVDELEAKTNFLLKKANNVNWKNSNF